MENGLFSAAVTIAGGFILAGAAHWIIRWLKKKADETETEIDNIILNAVGTPLVIAIISVAFYIALTRYDIVPASLSWLITDQLINAVFIVLGAWIASVFSYNLIHTYANGIAEKTKTDLDDRLIPILEVIAKYLIWFVALLLILAEFKIDITPLLAGAGIAGIALALAAQDILGNFMSGAIIAVDKPFKIGDRVKIDSFFGDVISIGPRSTRIKTLDHLFVTVPNSKITTSIIINYAMPDVRMKVRIPFSVAYGSNMKKVKEISALNRPRSRRKNPVGHERSRTLGVFSRIRRIEP